MDVIVWAYIDCRKWRDAGSVVWPLLKADEIANALSVSTSSVNRAVRNLRKFGFLETMRTQTGNRMILGARANAPDTFRGRQAGDPEKDFTRLPLLLITSGVEKLSLLVWVLLDRRKGAGKTVSLTQATLAKMLQVDVRTVRRAIEELQKCGLVAVYRQGYKRANWYSLSSELAMRKEPHPMESNPVNRIFYAWARAAFKEVERARGWVSENPEKFREMLGLIREALPLYSETDIRSVIYLAVKGRDPAGLFYALLLEMVDDAYGEANGPALPEAS
ncbi:helix-turn-helix domain-containing protein [Streptosporangium carneum]|uniref:helix-turn-helix domain-containing protein n=1 Tax=Streptosporangium carneum TaxID=47481 RepID=UPI0031E7F707